MAKLGMSASIAGSMGDVRSRVESALKEQGFGILTEINMQKTLMDKIGVEIEPFRLDEMKGGTFTITNGGVFGSMLSTPILPPISSASRLEMARPKPVPPYLRMVEPSAWVKEVKRIFCLLAGMPMPLSLTEKRSVAFFSSAFSRLTRINISPSSVNFTELLPRLTRIWRSLLGSPRRSDGTSGST